MVAVANKLANAARGHLGVFLREIHRHLARHHIIALTALRVDLRGSDIIMLANLLKDIVHGKRAVVNLHGALHHSLCQAHVDVAIVNDGIGHQ